MSLLLSEGVWTGLWCPCPLLLMQGGYSLEPPDSVPPEFWLTSGDWVLDTADRFWILNLTDLPIKYPLLVEPLALNDTDLSLPLPRDGGPLERADERFWYPDGSPLSC